MSAIKLGPVAHAVLIALMITVLGLIYLNQATKTTSYGYEAQAVDAQIANLEVKKADLEVENARLTSLETVSNSQVASTLTAPSGTDYVR